ncbi:hypothetical protein CTAYLR_010397 [Chrysophaeum taylorii]|uniref:HRDC domain-containing protein n=1 Tax=Chrysophaeum taylorii TaxID=2483200 RepID=A0AAD7XL00_9STRA|nr:hypothetical protein CTAYLR_010397 [Chrysophaeum taylorii]
MEELLGAMLRTTQAANKVPGASEFGFATAMSAEWGVEADAAAEGVRKVLALVVGGEETEDEDQLFDRALDFVEGLLEDADAAMSAERREKAGAPDVEVVDSTTTKPEPFLTERARTAIFSPRPWDGRESRSEDEHPFDAELREWTAPVSQLQAPPPAPLEASPSHFDDSECGDSDDSEWRWVDTAAGVAAMGRELEGATELAVDLEHHSWRSFHGLLCLVQVTRRSPRKDYLVDVLASDVRASLPRVLGPYLADPGVVKVLHGADSDIVWLERDLGLYVVNLFDTAVACDRLGYASKSLAELLRRHAGFDGRAAKRHFQRADWRQRPLPTPMRAYARRDTHYLLFVYDVLRRELGPTETLAVLEASRRVCRRRFSMPRFDPNAWRSHVAKRGGNVHEAVAKALWDWRDMTARELDESPGYVLSLDKLVAVATSRPTTPDRVHHVAGPRGFLPAHPDRHLWAAAIADLVRRALDDLPDDGPGSLSPPIDDDDDEDVRPFFFETVLVDPNIRPQSAPHRRTLVQNPSPTVALLGRLPPLDLEPTTDQTTTTTDHPIMNLAARAGWFSDPSALRGEPLAIWRALLAAPVLPEPAPPALPEPPIV